MRINIQDSDSQSCQIQNQPRKPKSCLLFYTHKSRETFSHISRRLLMLVSQPCPSFCDPMDSSPPGFSVHGILQARILEWVAFPFSRGASQPRDQTWVPCTAGSFFTIWVTEEAPETSNSTSQNQNLCLGYLCWPGKKPKIPPMPQFLRISVH